VIELALAHDGSSGPMARHRPPPPRRSRRNPLLAILARLGAKGAIACKTCPWIRPLVLMFSVCTNRVASASPVHHAATSVIAFGPPAPAGKQVCWALLLCLIKIQAAAPELSPACSVLSRGCASLMPWCDGWCLLWTRPTESTGTGVLEGTGRAGVDSMACQKRWRPTEAGGAGCCSTALQRPVC